MSRHRALIRHSLHLSAAAVIACTISPPFLTAQSLGDVARLEQARRKTVPAGKVYTNGDLPVVEPAVPMPPAPSQQADAAAAAGAQATPEQPAAAATAPGVEKDEKYWRTRVAGEREALGRAETFAEALQSRINALSADFVNRDDPAQRNVIAGDREKALAELERVRKEIADHKTAIADIQDEARRAGVPAGWVR